MEEEVIGDNPTLGGDMQTMVEFDAAIICIHGRAIAPSCAICHRSNWLDCPVRPDQSGAPRTVGDVVREFLAAKKIPSVKVVRQYVREKQRQARAAARRRAKPAKLDSKGRNYKKWSIIAGLVVASGILLYEGGKLVLKLGSIKRGKRSPSGGRQDRRSFFLTALLNIIKVWD